MRRAREKGGWKGRAGDKRAPPTHPARGSLFVVHQVAAAVLARLEVEAARVQVHAVLQEAPPHDGRGGQPRAAAPRAAARHQLHRRGLRAGELLRVLLLLLVL